MTDVSTAQRFVADRYGERAGGVTLLGAGEWSRAYAFALDGRPAVIRFGAYGQDFAKDRIMAGASAAALPVPEFIDMGLAPGGYFAVSVRAYGVALDDLDEPAMRAVLPALLSALDAVRDLVPPTTAGYGLWPAGGPGQADTWAAALLSIDEDRARTPGWRDRLATSRAGEGAFRAGYARLAELVDRLPSERHVIHGDLLNRISPRHSSGRSHVHGLAPGILEVVEARPQRRHDSYATTSATYAAGLMCGVSRVSVRVNAISYVSAARRWAASIAFAPSFWAINR